MPTFEYICEVCGAAGKAYRTDKPPRFCSRACRVKGVSPGKRSRWPITPAMHDRIREVYQQPTGRNQVNELASELGLPRWKVTRHAIVNGWIARTKKEPEWTDQELSILERSAHRVPERIQIYLKRAGFHRSCLAIVLKRRRMRFLKNMQGQSARGLAVCFGVDPSTIARWIKTGLLHAMPRGTKRTAVQGGDMWHIRDRWVRDFVINHIAEVDIRKVDKFWLVDLLAGTDTQGLGPCKVTNGEQGEPEPEDDEEEDVSDHIREIFEEAAIL